MESPTKAKTLGRFLSSPDGLGPRGQKYEIVASMGHVRDLPESKLGVDVEHDFAPEYVVSAKKAETVKSLQSKSKQANKVILATDPDREGEAIAFHISELIKDQIKVVGSGTRDRKLGDGEMGNRVQRITFHEITEAAIRDALASPSIINMQLVDAQQARRVLDRLVGYKLSPLLWRKVRKGLSAGRVQSVAVRLIVEREREILAFKPEEYWEIVGRFIVDDVHSRSGSTMSDEQLAMNQFEAKLAKINDKTAEIKTKEEADKIVGELSSSQFTVDKVETREVKRYPYPPFTTSTLQQAASNLFGWSAKRTMQVAQNLYEEGLITYHRTDSTNLAIEAVNQVRGFISAEYGEKYLPEGPKFYKTRSKVAQEAHEAIRPTVVTQGMTPKESLDRDQARLYELIWNRFVACQMTEAVYEQTTVDIQGTRSPEIQTKYLFRANGSRQLFDGWQRVTGNGEDGVMLPALSVGEILALLGLTPSQHFTEPPGRYTEASLIKALEEYGIGRPSTYAPIISTIQDRQYVEKVDKKLQPTNLGFAVNDFLMANFADIMDYQFTAGMEDSLDAIANGEKQWVPVIRDFYDPFAEQLEKVAETAERVKIEAEVTSEMCPIHNVPLVVRIGRFGKFLACSKFPECKFTKSFQQKINMKCPKCGVGEVILRRTRSKKSFYGCSRYPDCDFASWTKPKPQAEAPVEKSL